MGLSHLAPAMRRDTSSGTPLKTVWQSLTAIDALFRRSSLVIVGAGAGTGKSAFALTLAIKSGAKAIYHSADSNKATQLSRAVSIITGRPVSETRKAVDEGHYFERELASIPNIRWDFEPGPTLFDIRDNSEGYAYLHGEHPELIIVDNLMDVVVDDLGEGSHVSNNSTLQFLDELAKHTGACVLVLQHLKSDYNDGDKSPPQSALINQTSKKPAMVLTLFKTEDQYGGSRLGVNVVKNRDGEMNAAGKLTVELELDLSKMLIKDLE